MRLLAASGFTSALIAPTALLAAAGAGGIARESGVQWSAREDVLTSIRDVLLLKHEANAPMYWLLILVLAGAITSGRLRRLWWLLACSVLFTVLSVMATASDQAITELLTLPWWNDAFCLVALAVFGLAMLAGQGLTTLMDEQQAMAVLGQLVRPGERVMNDPSDGSPWMWALDDVHPMFPRIIFRGEHPRMSADAQTLFNSFQCLDADPEVREVIGRYNITYAYVGEGFARADFTRLYGMRDLSAADSLELVYRQGEIRIYRIELSERPEDSTAASGCERYSRERT